MFSCNINIFRKDFLIFIFLILPGFSLADFSLPRSYHPFHDKDWHGDIEYVYLDIKKTKQTAKCRLTLYKTQKWTKTLTDPKTKKKIIKHIPEQLSIRIVPYNTREHCPFSHTHTMDLKDVIDKKDSSKLHLNLGFGAIEKYKKVIAPDFLNKSDNDLLTVTASYAKDSDSDLLTESDLTDLLTESDLTDLLTESDLTDLLTESDLTDLDSTPEKPRDFTTIRKISGKIDFAVKDPKKPETPKNTWQTGITIRAFTRDEPINVKFRVDKWSTIKYNLSACTNKNCLRGISNFYGCTQSNSPCCGADGCGSYDTDNKEFCDLPPNTTVQLFSYAGRFIFSWRFPVPGDYRISMWGPIPFMSQISQIYNPSCGNKDNDGCWDEVKEATDFNFTSAYGRDTDQLGATALFCEPNSM